MRTYVYQIRCAAADAEAAGEEVRRVDACRSLLRRGWLSPLDSHRVFVVDAPLDVAAMRAAAAVLLGTHDFTSLRAASCGAKSPVRDLVELSVLEEAPTALAALQSECQRHLAIRVRAKSFLQNQVRYLVATLLQAGQGQITADGVAQLLAARDNRRAPTLAPAHGLFLARVDYPESSYASTAPPPPAADEDDSDNAEGAVGPPAEASGHVVRDPNIHLSVSTTRSRRQHRRETRRAAVERLAVVAPAAGAGAAAAHAVASGRGRGDGVEIVVRLCLGGAPLRC